MTGDFFQLCLKHFEYPNKQSILLDISDQEEIDEVITCAKFHDVTDTLFMYGSSNGNFGIGDLR